MSTIAYRKGVLAADTRAYGGQRQASPGTKQKLHCLSDGSLIGISSAVLGAPERLVEWLNAGGDPKEFGSSETDCQAIKVTRTGMVYILDGGLYFSGPITSHFCAVGSGAKYALGAMQFGATAEDAVQAAAELDFHTGGPVTTLTINTLDEDDDLPF